MKPKKAGWGRSLVLAAGNHPPAGGGRLKRGPEAPLKKKKRRLKESGGPVDKRAEGKEADCFKKRTGGKARENIVGP